MTHKFHSSCILLNCILIQKILRLEIMFSNVYYSQFDKHNCIDFHGANCNLPTTSLLDNLKCLSSISSNICSFNYECNRLQFFMQIIN